MVNAPLTVAFDCDETLWVNSPYGDDGHPNLPMVSFFKTFQKLGCEMYIWSAAGVEWAEEVMKNCGLSAIIVEKPPLGTDKHKQKFLPDIAVDDWEDLGKMTLFVHDYETLARRSSASS